MKAAVPIVVAGVQTVQLTNCNMEFGTTYHLLVYISGQSQGDGVASPYPIEIEALVNSNEFSLDPEFLSSLT